MVHSVKYTAKLQKTQSFSFESDANGEIIERCKMSLQVHQDISFGHVKTSEPNQQKRFFTSLIILAHCKVHYHF
jgi:hypothetical protein